MEKTKLPKKFKQKWVKALRSGKFKQGKNYLRSINFDENNKQEINYCCLGVVCAINGLTSITDKELVVKGEKIRGINKLPKDFVDNESLQEQLATMNDRGDSFEEIANYIEKEL